MDPPFNEHNSDEMDLVVLETSKLLLVDQQAEDIYTLKCVKCNNVFLSEDDFLKHECKNIDTNKLKCSLCQETFNTDFNLALHNLIHSQRSIYQCDICDDLFTSEIKFYIHVENHTKKN